MPSILLLQDFGMSRLLPQQVAEELDLINHRSASPALRGSFMHAPDSDVMGFRKSSSPNNSESERVTHVAASSDLSRDNNYSGDDGNSEGVNAALSPALNSLLPTALDDLEAQVGVTSSDPQLEDPRQQSRHPTTSAGVRDAGFHSSNGGSADEEQEDGSRGAPPPNSVAVAMPKPRRAVPASVDPADSTTTTADAPPQPLQPPPPVARSIGERVYITDGAGVAMTSNVGTVAWCAPEIFNNGQDATTSYSLAADTYSFGMCLYELAERRAPFDHLSSRLGYNRFEESMSERGKAGVKIVLVCPQLFSRMKTFLLHLLTKHTSSSPLCTQVRHCRRGPARRPPVHHLSFAHARAACLPCAHGEMLGGHPRAEARLPRNRGDPGRALQGGAREQQTPGGRGPQRVALGVPNVPEHLQLRWRRRCSWCARCFQPHSPPPARALRFAHLSPHQRPHGQHWKQHRREHVHALHPR